jgi:hypothetical protein
VFSYRAKTEVLREYHGSKGASEQGGRDWFKVKRKHSVGGRVIHCLKELRVKGNDFGGERHH